MSVLPTAAPSRSTTVRLATGPLVPVVERGLPNGAPVLFIHGWLDSWSSFDRVTALLPESIRAIAFDQRGFGDAERPPRGYSIDQFAADAVALLDALGVARATVVGHSLGSFVARCVAERYPERVASLVLIGTGAGALNDITRELCEEVQQLSDPISPEFVREFQGSTIHHPVPPEFFERVVAATMKAPAFVWKAALDGVVAFDDSDDLARIMAPTTIIWGDRDALFTSRAEQERLATTIQKCALIVLPETGHSPNWERPEPVADAILTALAQAQ